jgi:hypothetical protein
MEISELFDQQRFRSWAVNPELPPTIDTSFKSSTKSNPENELVASKNRADFAFQIYLADRN